MEVAFGNGTTTPDDKGAWNPFKGGKEFTFTKPAHIDHLVVLELSRPARAEAEAAALQQAEKEAAAAEAEKKAAGLAKLLDTLHSVASERGMRLPSLNGPFFHRLDLSWRDLNHTNVLTGDKLETFLLGLLGPRGLGLGSTDLVSPNPNPNPNPTLS